MKKFLAFCFLLPLCSVSYATDFYIFYKHKFEIPNNFSLLMLGDSIQLSRTVNGANDHILYGLSDSLNIEKAEGDENVEEVVETIECGLKIRTISFNDAESKFLSSVRLDSKELNKYALVVMSAERSLIDDIVSQLCPYKT